MVARILPEAALSDRCSILRRVEAETGSTGTAYVRADHILPGYVASAVGYASDYRQPTLHRGLPSAHLTFIFSLADPVVSGWTPEHARGHDPFRNLVLLGGLHTSPAYVVPDERQRGIQMSVHPLAARALFGAPSRELATLVADGPEVLGADAGRIRDRMLEATTWPARFGILQEYLRDRVDGRSRRQERVRPELLEAWRWLAWHRGTGSIDGLAAHVHLSPRQLRTLFTREVGLGPKQVSRLMRFSSATSRIASTVAAGTTPDLAGIAALCGYFDHAHLDRDFAQFAGISPRGWVAEERRNIQDGGHRNGETLTHD
jgi:AraC-like DNA-binding protein